jgi:hypothetical protein
VRFFAPFQTGLGAQPAAYTTSTGSFPSVKRLRPGADHPPHLEPKLKKEYSWTFAAYSRVNFTFYLLYDRKLQIVKLIGEHYARSAHEQLHHIDTVSEVYHSALMSNSK